MATVAEGRHKQVLGVWSSLSGAVTDSGGVWRKVPEERLGVTLRASLSSIFLQTLPDLVTSLKGYSLSPRSCPATRSRPPKGSGTNMTVEAT